MEGKKEYRERMWANGLATAEYTNVYIFIDFFVGYADLVSFFAPRSRTSHFLSIE